MKNFLLCLAVLCAISANAQPPVEWSGVMGTVNFDVVSDMVSDSEGNIYLTGYFNGEMDIDPGSAEVLINSGSAQNIFVQKLSSSGELIWHYSLTGDTETIAYGLAIDSQNNVYIVGSFQSAADFDAGTGVSFLVATGNNAGFMLKLNSSGQFAWVKGFMSSGFCDAMRVNVDTNNTIYVSGQYSGTLDANPGTGVNNLTTSGGLDLFIVKFSTSGNYVWSGSFGADEYQGLVDMELDNDGNVLIAGNFAGTGDFDPSAGTSTLTTSFYTQLFIVKLTSTGEFVFALQFGSDADNEEFYAIKTDSENNIVLCGYFIAAVDFDNSAGSSTLNSIGFSDHFLVKLSSDGSLQWAKSLGSDSSEIIGALDIDNNDNIYFGTSILNAIDFDLTEGVNSFQGISGADIALAKYDAQANLQWVSILGGSGSEVVSRLNAFADDILYVAGNFEGNAIFGNSANATEYTSAGMQDLFALRMSCISYGQETASGCNSFLWPVDGNTYNASGVYTGTLVNAAGCDSIITLNLSIQTVSADVTQTGNTLSAQQNNAEYQWFTCGSPDEPIQNANEQQFTASANGSYRVQITLDSCVALSECITISNISVHEHSDIQILVSPNPMQEEISIKSNQKITAVSIFDMNQRLVYTGGAPANNSMIHLGQIEAGIYVIKCSLQNGQEYYTKLIKE